MSTWKQLGLQDSASSIMEEFTFFHDYIMVTLVLIITNVLMVMCFLGANRTLSLVSSENQILETIWTLVPALILINLAIPSLTLLYMLEEDVEHPLVVKAMGHQWYWSYEMTQGPSEISFDSYMTPVEGSLGGVRLLDVDNRLTLPYGVPTRVLISSSDVLHSWTVPSLGVKADACPGRINQITLMSHRPGVFYGQCSEICGANHSFMPIVIEFVSMGDFLKTYA